MPNRSRTSPQVTEMTLVPLLLICSFFVAPSGLQLSQQDITAPGGVEPGEASRGPVLDVAPSAIGRASAPTCRSVPDRVQQQQLRNQSPNECVKDEYLFTCTLNFESDTLLTEDYFEYEQGSSDIIVKGRLKSHVQFWKDIGSYPFIIDVIENGYKIPLFSTPPSVCLHNNRSAIKHGEFVGQAIHDLLVRGLIVECSSMPTVVNPLTVSVQNSGKKRLILDLRHVNKHLWKSSVKFEDIRTAMYFLNQGDFCFKFDLHSAYHHIDIFEPHTEFLGFSWQFGGNVKYFRFKVLPFGLSSACYIFIKVTRPLVKKWRSEGKQVLMYLDDGLGRHSDFDKCSQIAMEIKRDIIASGFVPKVEKSMWNPCTDITFLGYDLHLLTGIISIPKKRIEKVQQTIVTIQGHISESGQVGVRLVASLVGQIISMSYVTGNVVYIMTKYLSADIARQHHGISRSL